MFRRLHSSVAHPLHLIDPYLDARRDEGEQRHVPLRAVLRRLAAITQRHELVDPASPGSFGALMVGSTNLEAALNAMSALLDTTAHTKAAVCLVRPTTRLLTPAEADALTSKQRQRCIPVAKTDNVALPLDEDELASATPHVVVRMDKTVLGSGAARDARMELSRPVDDAVSISIVSAAGIRTRMSCDSLPPTLLDRLFGVGEGRPTAVDAEDEAESAPCAATGPTKRNELPMYAQAALVDFLERKGRLQVLTTAAAAYDLPPEDEAPARPVVLETATLKEFDQSHSSWIRVSATLHGSSSTCICRAHGLRFNCKGSVVITAETCGRPLEHNASGNRCCPCHQNAVDRYTGEARFSVDGLCTEATTLSVTCWHREGSTCRRGVRIDNLHMRDSDRCELAALLVGVAEFDGRTSGFFKRGYSVDQPEIDRHARVLGAKMRERLESIELDQLQEEDPTLCNAKELLERDMLSVDLLRGGGVFRHHVKRGANRNRPYLKRREGAEPLTPREEKLVCTHGHLFRRAVQ